MYSLNFAVPRKIPNILRKTRKMLQFYFTNTFFFDSNLAAVELSYPLSAYLDL